MGEPPLPLAVAAGSRSRRLGSAGGSRCATCEESKGSSSSSAAASVPSLSQATAGANSFAVLCVMRDQQAVTSRRF